MDNQEKVENLINAFGALSELWLSTFNSFRQMGLDEDEAFKHTAAFMTCVISAINNANNGGN